MQPHSRTRSLLAGSLGAVMLLGLSTPVAGAAQKAPSRSGASSVVAKVPPKYHSKGALTVAEDASYAPNEFFAKDGRTIVGMDADLARALAGAMGLRADVVNASFDSILPGLASGKYDLGISSFTDTKQRERIVDFVTYFRAGTAFFEKSHGGPAVSGLASLCGLRVAVEKGTTQAVDAQDQSAKCTASGHKAVTVEIFPDQGSANLALVSGRADVGMADSPLAYYQAKQSHGALKVVGPTYGTAPYGIAVPKGSGLAPAVLAALKYLMGNGAYKAILDKWGVSNGAISNPVIDGAQS